MSRLLSVQDLSVTLWGNGEWLPLLRGIDFDIEAGEIVGLVGESGSGKSLTALSILGLLPTARPRVTGRIELAGLDLLTLTKSNIEHIRGRRVGMVFQEPMSALNPVLTVGYQIAECVLKHRQVDRQEARREAIRLMDMVAIPASARRVGDYPHQLSGGQRQRVMIAMAMAGGPDLLIADEPTTALDVTVQAQILGLLETLNKELNLSILLITHDLAVVAENCHRVVVLYAGQVVERSPVRDLFRDPAHPYSRSILSLIAQPGEHAPSERAPRASGRLPDPTNPVQGCTFHPRCPEVFSDCETREPQMISQAEDRSVRCFLYQHRNGEASEN